MAKQSSGGGLSFLGALGIVFITLKLCDVIDWQWWLVLLPLYCVPVILTVIVLSWCGIAGLLFSVAGVVCVVKNAWRNNN